MARRDEALKHLAAVPLFKDCTKKELELILRVSTPITVNAGETLIKEGEFAQQMMILMEGSAIVRRNGRKVATLEPGAILGELALLTNRRRNATVVAATDVNVLVIDPRGFSSVLADVPSVTRTILSTVA